MTKKNINSTLSNRKSKTKISKINPSNRLICQKNDCSRPHETSAYTWGTSTNLGFHQQQYVFPSNKRMCL